MICFEVEMVWLVLFRFIIMGIPPFSDRHEKEPCDLQGPCGWWSVRNPPERMEVRLPVGISEVGITDGTSAVQHFVIAHINAAVGNACDILAHRAVKEHDVSRLCLFLWHIAAQATQPLGSKASGIVDTAVGKHIADKTRAVEGRFRGGSAQT